MGKEKTSHAVRSSKTVMRIWGTYTKLICSSRIIKLTEKAKKWWHMIMFHFIDVCLVNAYIIHKQLRQLEKYPTLKHFRLDVAEGLIGAPILCNQKQIRTKLPSYKVFMLHDVRYDKVNHLRAPCTSCRCALCSTKKQPRRTRCICQVCHVGLCLLSERNCLSQFDPK